MKLKKVLKFKEIGNRKSGRIFYTRFPISSTVLSYHLFTV